MTISAIRFTHLGNFSRTATTTSNGAGVLKRSVDLTLPNGKEMSREKTITKTDTGVTVTGSITTEKGTLNYTRLRVKMPPIALPPSVPIEKDPIRTTDPIAYPVDAAGAEAEKIAANEIQPIKVGPGQEPGPIAPQIPHKHFDTILPIKVGSSGPFIPYTPQSARGPQLDTPISLYPVDETA